MLLMLKCHINYGFFLPKIRMYYDFCGKTGFNFDKIGIQDSRFFISHKTIVETGTENLPN